jgi:hypothetical protein
MQLNTFNIPLMPQGYLGSIEDIPVIASIHMPRGSVGLVSSAERPFDIRDQNSLWLDPKIEE